MKRGFSNNGVTKGIIPYVNPKSSIKTLSRHKRGRWCLTNPLIFTNSIDRLRIHFLSLLSLKKMVTDRIRQHSRLTVS